MIESDKLKEYIICEVDKTISDVISSYEEIDFNTFNKTLLIPVKFKTYLIDNNVLEETKNKLIEDDMILSYKLIFPFYKVKISFRSESYTKIKRFK